MTTSALKHASIYNLDNKATAKSVGGGVLTQTKGAASFDSQLNLSGVDPSGLVIGQSYYVVGLDEKGHPVRTETIVYRSGAGGSAHFEGSKPLPQRPAGWAPRVAQDSAPDILISYANYASTAFSLSTWWANLQDGFGGLTSSPGPTLAANSGLQSIGANQVLSSLDEGPADIGLCWASGYSFGVWIHFNFQMFGIGPRPIWYVSANGSDWVLAGADPSNPYTWDASQVGGLSIVGTPASDHSSLTVSVVISNQ